jgi:hypothetical protein
MTDTISREEAREMMQIVTETLKILRMHMMSKAAAPSGFRLAIEEPAENLLKRLSAERLKDEENNGASRARPSPPRV